MKRTRVLYLEVADKIKEDIFSGKYPVGSMLPTESELEELFQVSKITVERQSNCWHQMNMSQRKVVVGRRF